MNVDQLMYLLSKKKFDAISSDEAFELIKLLEEAENEVRTWVNDNC